MKITETNTSDSFFTLDWYQSIPRSTFWKYLVLNFVAIFAVALVLVAVFSMTGSAPEGTALHTIMLIFSFGAGIAGLFYFIKLCLLQFAYIMARFRNIGVSPWWTLLVWFGGYLYIGWLMIIVLGCVPTKKDDWEGAEIPEVEL